MDQEQTQFLRHWLVTRFVKPMFGALSDKAESLTALPGAADCSLFAAAFNSIVEEEEPRQTFGGPKLQLMHRLKSAFRSFHLDTSDLLASVFRRLDSESGKVDLLALLHLLTFLSTTDTDSRITAFDSFATNLHLLKTLQLAFSIYVRVLAQMQTYAKTTCGDSPFQPTHFHNRSESAVLKRQRMHLEAEIEELKVTNKQLQMQVLALNEKENRCVEPEIRRENVAKRLELQFECERIEERARELEEKDAVIIKCQREIAKLKNEKSRLADDLDVLKEKLSDFATLERRLQAYKDKIETFDSVKAELTDVKAALQVCVQDKAALAQRLHESQMQAAKSEFLEKEMGKLESKYVAALRESGELKLCLEDLQAQCSSRPIVSHITVQEDIDSDSETEEMRTKLSLAEVEITNLRTVIESQQDTTLRMNVEKAVEEAEFLRKARDDWLVRVAFLEAQIASNTARFESERRKLQQTVENTKEENAVLKEKLAGVILEVKELKGELNKAWKTVQEEHNLGLSYKSFSEELSRELTDMKNKEVAWVGRSGQFAHDLDSHRVLVSDLAARVNTLLSLLPPYAAEDMKQETETLLSRVGQCRGNVLEEAFHTPDSR